MEKTSYLLNDMPRLEVEVSLEPTDVYVLGEDEHGEQDHGEPEGARAQQVVPDLVEVEVQEDHRGDEAAHREVQPDGARHHDEVQPVPLGLHEEQLEVHHQHDHGEGRHARLQERGLRAVAGVAVGEREERQHGDEGRLDQRREDPAPEHHGLQHTDDEYSGQMLTSY